MGEKVANILLRLGLVEAGVFGQRHRHCPADRIEGQAVGDRMQGAAAEGAESGEGFQGIANNGEHDCGGVADGQAEAGQQVFDIQLAHGDIVDACQLAHHGCCQRALDDDVGARRDRCHGADHGAARVAEHDRFGFARGHHARQGMAALFDAGQHGHFARRFECRNATGGDPFQFVQQTLHFGFTLALDILDAAICQAALESFRATGAGSDNGARQLSVTHAQRTHQLVALVAVIAVDLVEHEDHRLAELAQPAQLVVLRAREIGADHIDHDMRAQCFIARQLLALQAIHLAAAGHVGDDQLAPVRQRAAKMLHPARGAAGDIDLERFGGIAETAHQTGFSGADLAEHRHVAFAALAPAVEFEQFLFQAGGAAVVQAQFGDTRLDARPIGQRARSALRIAARAWPQQFPAEHGQSAGSRRRQRKQRVADQCRQPRQAFLEFEQAVEQAEDQADKDQRADHPQDKDKQAQRQA